MAENTIKTIDVAAKVADQEFVMDFESDVRKLVEVLGIFEPIKRAPLSALRPFCEYLDKIYVSSIVPDVATGA